MWGDMLVMVKCGGEEAGNMLLRRTRRSTHNDRGALVNVHDHGEEEEILLNMCLLNLKCF